MYMNIASVNQQNHNISELLKTISISDPPFPIAAFATVTTVVILTLITIIGFIYHRRRYVVILHKLIIIRRLFVIVVINCDKSKQQDI